MLGVFARGAVFGLGLFASVLFANVACAADAQNAAGQTTPSHPIVPGFERFAGTRLGKGPRSGPVAVGGTELRFLPSIFPRRISRLIQTKQAPILDDVGTRVRVEYLRAFLNDPQHTKPGTTMPNLFAKSAGSRTQTAGGEPWCISWR